MKYPKNTSVGVEDFVAYWNDMNLKNRLKFIMNNQDLFWSLGLITRSEIEVVMEMSSGEINYILKREDQPIFTSINIKDYFEFQSHRKKLETALQTVFYKNNGSGVFSSEKINYINL